MCNIVKKGEGLDKINPKYFMKVYNKGVFILAARRVLNSSYKYEFSLFQEDFSSSALVGRMSSNFVGTVFNIYNEGKPHQEAKSANELRQQFAVVTYVRYYINSLRKSTFSASKARPSLKCICQR